MNKRVIQAPRGLELSTINWQVEAPLRMLMNNLDPEVAENPNELIVYGGIGKAARNWQCYDLLVNTLKRLEAEDTLLVQSGKPVGVFKTHKNSPRVLIANSNLVPHWANWDTFNELDKKGLMMYGQMTAGSWIYIGSQGIIQGTYETFNAVAKQHFNSELSGKWILTAGLGGMGGAQPLAGTMAGACVLVVECDDKRIKRRLESGFVDIKADNLEHAVGLIKEKIKQKKTISVALLANASDVYEQLLMQNIIPDIVTDQTSAHDPLYGYLPSGWDMHQYHDMQKNDPKRVIEAAKQSMAKQVEAMCAFNDKGAVVFDYGNNIRQIAFEAGCQHAFSYPGFVPAYIRPLFCEGIGPFRWVALSGDPDDIKKTDNKVKELFPEHKQLHRWIDMAQKKIPFQGLPARICWLGLGERQKVGLAFNAMVAQGKLRAPIAIGRDHLDAGSVASPNRETEGMLDGSDAVSDWPILNALLNCASGATWVSVHHGGGVGMGFSQHAGFVVVCDGSVDSQKRIARVLTNDPATGVMRHVDAGYKLAKSCARKNRLDLPGM